MPILDETVLTLSEAPKHLPRRGGKRVSISTVWRWARKGSQGVRLEYAKLGRSIYTSREALTRFSEALAVADRASVEAVSLPPAKAASKKRSAGPRESEVEAAKARLNAAGI